MTDPPPRTTKKIPEKIGGFEIIGPVGKGGMGDVYKARQSSLNRLVALKILPAEFSRNEEFSQRFESEAKVVSKLEHQNIVTIYDYDSQGETRYLAMQFIEGENLGQRIKHKGKLPEEEVVEIAKQVGRALKYAHEKRILHRDIKPQNILLSKKGKVLVTDFGIAKMYQQTRITNTGMVVGTPEYMSPEQAEGLELDQRTDIYSLGIVMYETLTGNPPFQADTPLGIAYKHVNTPPDPLSDKIPGIPSFLEHVVLKALKKDRESRYKNADEMLNDLDEVFIKQENKETQNIKPVHLNISKKVGFEKPAHDRRDSERRRGDASYRADRRKSGRLMHLLNLAAMISVILASLIVLIYFLYKFFSN